MLLRSHGAAPDATDHYLGGLAPDFERGQSDRRQRRLQMCRDRKVAKADQRQIFRNAHVQGAAHLVQSQRQAVIRRQDSGRTIGCGQGREQRRHVGRWVTFDGPDIFVEQREIRFRQRTLIADLAMLHGHGRIRRGQEADAVMAEPEQMLGGLQRPAKVVCRHIVGRELFEVAVDNDQWAPAFQ